MALPTPQRGTFSTIGKLILAALVHRGYWGAYKAGIITRETLVDLAKAAAYDLLVQAIELGESDIPGYWAAIDQAITRDFGPGRLL